MTIKETAKAVHALPGLEKLPIYLLTFYHGRGDREIREIITGGHLRGSISQSVIYPLELEDVLVDLFEPKRSEEFGLPGGEVYNSTVTRRILVAVSNRELVVTVYNLLLGWRLDKSFNGWTEILPPVFPDWEVMFNVLSQWRPGVLILDLEPRYHLPSTFDEPALMEKIYRGWLSRLKGMFPRLLIILVYTDRRLAKIAQTLKSESLADAVLYTEHPGDYRPAILETINGFFTGRKE